MKSFTKYEAQSLTSQIIDLIDQIVICYSESSLMDVEKQMRIILRDGFVKRLDKTLRLKNQLREYFDLDAVFKDYKRLLGKKRNELKVTYKNVEDSDVPKRYTIPKIIDVFNHYNELWEYVRKGNNLSSYQKFEYQQSKLVAYRLFEKRGASSSNLRRLKTMFSCIDSKIAVELSKG